MWQWEKRLERMVSACGGMVVAMDVFLVFMAMLLTAIWFQCVINL